MALREMPILLDIGLEAGDAASAVQRLAGMLQRAGHVTADYGAAVAAREATFPTGLPTEPPVALPHADPDHVLHSAMAVGVFRAPVTFHEMGSPERTLPVRIVFLLAVKEKEAAAGLLRELVVAFRDHERLARLQEAETVHAARAILDDLLSQQTIT
ncbi:MAG: PTS sugar transporter subunit IIA [Armatimonadota bacterium]|nr:PTS sugar transporter subunit IIA [Armatimonadota bacterium]